MQGSLTHIKPIVLGDCLESLFGWRFLYTRGEFLRNICDFFEKFEF